MNITMKIVCVFFLSCVTTGNASSFMDEDGGGSIFAIPHHRELETTCSGDVQGPEQGGDCSANPTYCNGTYEGAENNIVHCGCNDADPFLNFGNDNANCYSASEFEQISCGGCLGSCFGTNSCLNLDLHCAEGQACELGCHGINACEGVTMYCPANQVCKIFSCGEWLGDETESCVGAKIICGSGTVAVGDFACEPALYKYEIMPVLGNIGTSILGGTGTNNYGANNYGAVFQLNLEHSTELCLNDCDPKELTVSVYNSYNGEHQCEGDAFDSTKQTISVFDGSLSQVGDMHRYNNAKISIIEVTFDDVFEANIISSSTADGSSGSIISLCIRVETTDGTHMFGKVDTAITQAIELNGEITTSKLGVANFDAYSNNLVLDDGTLKIEGTPAPYMCSEDGANDSGAVVIGGTMNICVPDDESFKVDYIKNVVCSNGSEDFFPFDNVDSTASSGLPYTMSDSASGEMIGIEIKAEYLPANSGTSLFECSGTIVYSYDKQERRLAHRELQEPTTTEEAEAEFSLTIMITNEEPTLDSAGTKKMANIPVFTMIVTATIFQSAMMLMNQL